MHFFLMIFDEVIVAFNFVCNEIIFFSSKALICGTSTCHMAISGDELFVPGVWGPYYNSMIPNVWLIEGGQSATGKLIDRSLTAQRQKAH